MGTLLKHHVLLLLLNLILSYISLTDAGYGVDLPTDPKSDGGGEGKSEGLFDRNRFGSIFGKRKSDAYQVPPYTVYESDGTTFLGRWRIHNENAGVACMHIQILPSGKVIMYDSTSNGLSEIELIPRRCIPRVGGRFSDPKDDCTAHAVEMDIETGKVTPVKLDSSPWCSSGSLTRSGNLLSTGGDKGGFQSVRLYRPCPNCAFEESTRALFANRWYATQHPLENGTMVLIGGRNAYNYEFIPPDTLNFRPQMIELPLLEETDDDGGRENNLYPFVNLLPDGNLFVFANYKSIILNPYTGETVRQLPDLEGGARNYPASGMSALLPLNLNIPDENLVNVEVIVCGGNTREAYTLADLQQPNRTFLPANKDCGRLILNVEGGQWEKEEMPSPRVMGDMLLLPNGEILMINGAMAGTSAWNAAKDPNLTPVLYSPNKPKGERFKQMAPTMIPRMYHSVSAVLPSGEVLVAGSNTNGYYMLDKYGDDYTFPTELRVEIFSPPYMNVDLDKYRLEILKDLSDKVLKYGGEFNLKVDSKGNELKMDEDVKVSMYSPPFTTHGYSQNQRLLILKLKAVTKEQITVVAPPSPTLAPPGFYLIFVVYRDVPSRGIWVQIQ